MAIARKMQEFIQKPKPGEAGYTFTSRGRLPSARTQTWQERGQAGPSAALTGYHEGYAAPKGVPAPPAFGDPSTYPASWGGIAPKWGEWGRLVPGTPWENVPIAPGGEGWKPEMWANAPAPYNLYGSLPGAPPPPPPGGGPAPHREQQGGDPYAPSARPPLPMAPQNIQVRQPPGQNYYDIVRYLLGLFGEH